MSCNFSCTTPKSSCPDKFGCPLNRCPDFIIRRHDNKPAFKLHVEDCDGPFDLTDLVLEASMWAKAKFKKSVTNDDEYFGFADDIGFEQVMVGDILIVDQVRLPEKMLVLGFDETNKFIRVQRGYHGTTPKAWKKGTSLKIIKFMGATAQTEMVYQDIIQMDGTVATNQLTDSFLIYEWGPTDTCLPGCYWLEFKLMKMSEEVAILSTSDVIPSFTDPDLTPADFGCGLGSGVEWVRRFPVDSNDGFLIKIYDSFSSES